MNGRLSALSFDLRLRRGYPDRATFGEEPDEGMDIHRAAAERAPVFVFVHGGVWLYLDAAMSAVAAEMFLDRGAHFVVLDFVPANALAGDLGRMADEVRRGIARGWSGTPKTSGAIRIESTSAVTPRGATSPPWP